MEASFQGLRVLIAHDWIMSWAGSERCVEQMLQIFPESDLVVGVCTPSMRQLNDVCRQARETWLSRVPGSHKHYQWFVPLEAAAFWFFDTSHYDLVISSSHAFAKAIRPSRHGLHLGYCHSPPRYVWDLYDTYASRTTVLRRAALRIGRLPLQILDRACADHVTHFVANSNYVAQRIERVYGRSARIVYPPVDLKVRSRSKLDIRRDDFLLYLGRLVPYKRLEILIQAARLINRRVVIAGDGPDRERLARIAGRQVEFLGTVSEKDGAELLDTCAAFVFCGEEDFGIGPVEANAHGAPVVAFRGGGVLETMIEGVTATFFDQATPESLAAAVRNALEKSWDVTALQTNALRFTPARFRAGFSEAIAAALEGETW